MERFFAGEKIEMEEIYAAVRTGVGKGASNPLPVAAARAHHCGVRVANPRRDRAFALLSGPVLYYVFRAVYGGPAGPWSEAGNDALALAEAEAAEDAA